MALEITVTKKGVAQIGVGFWSITLNMKCTDASVEVINQDFSIPYKSGMDIQVVAKKLHEQMQRVIDWYKASQTIFNHANLTAAVTWLNANLVG